MWPADFDDFWAEESTKPIPPPDHVWKVQATPVNDRYPHACPRCGHKAYVGLNAIEHHQAWRDKACK